MVVSEWFPKKCSTCLASSALVIFFLDWFFFWPHHTFLFLTRKVCMVTQKYVYWKQFKTWAHSIWQNKSGLNFQKISSWQWNRIFWLTVLNWRMFPKFWKKKDNLARCSQIFENFFVEISVPFLFSSWNFAEILVEQISGFLETFSRNLLTFYFSSKPAEISGQMESSPYILVILFFGSFYLDWSGYIQHNTIKTQVCSFCF